MKKNKQKNVTSVYTYDAEAAELIKDMADVNPEIVRAARLAGVTDDAETLVFARQLETISSRLYEKQYAELKGRSFVPFTNEAGPTTRFLTYRMWDGVTLAKLVSNYATDFPLVTASAREMFVKFFDFGNAYGYSVDEMQAAAATNIPLNDKLAMLARIGHEQAIDDAVCVGVPEIGTYGLSNHPNVSLISPVTGTWSGATGAQVLADLNYMVTKQWVDNLEILKGDTILVSTAVYRFLATKLLNDSNASNITVLEAFKEQNPGITVSSWTRLNTAAAGGTTSRIIFYKKDAMVLEFAMGQEFQTYPAQQNMLYLTIPCKSRFAGLILHLPMGISYMDGHNM